MQNKLKEILLKIWKIVKINKWEYLFNKDQNDTNLYFVLSWKIILLNNDDIIAFIQENELLGEKSFINNLPKPIDASIIEDWEILIVDNNSFNNLNDKEKIELLKLLMLYISHRVDMLNSIISNIKIISDKMYQYSWNIDYDKIIDIFKNIYEIHNFVIFKNEYWTLSKIIWDIYLDQYLENLIITQWKQDLKFVIDNEKILYIVTNDYIYYFKWIKKLETYIVNNIFLYLRPVFHMFAEKIENIKNINIENSYKNY